MVASCCYGILVAHAIRDGLGKVEVHGFVGGRRLLAGLFDVDNRHTISDLYH
jgi:hypothetical protein